MKHTRRPPGTPAPAFGPGLAHAPTGLPARPIGPASGGAARELVYEPVDASGLPLPVRDDVPALPGAALCDTPLGRCVVIDRTFDADSWHGRLRVEDGHLSSREVIDFCEAQMQARDPALAGLATRGAASTGASAASTGTASTGAASTSDAVCEPDVIRGRERGREARTGDDDDDGPVVFLDLETTGLSGGAGTVAFLVGCGYFERGAFRTRQFLLPGFGAERALLHAVTSCLDEAGCLVTYNGSTFDLPVMETRWLFHRQPLAWTDLTHLDMVHVSRRLWRARGDDPEASCRLIFLERDLFGVERVGDVAGFEIPGRYFEYIRHGQARLLEPVLHHNRLDLLSLALLTARAIRLVRDGLDATMDPQEWLAVGRELVRLNQGARAEACFRAVAEAPTATDPLRAEALYTWARLLRRARRYREAAEAWRRLVACRSARSVIRAEAHEALAVHYEHRDRDLGAAHEWASGAYEVETTRHRQDAVAHRLARLQRKIAVQTRGGPETALSLPWESA